MSSSEIAHTNIDTPYEGIAMYRMHQNTYLGDSIAVVYTASQAEIAMNGLTSNQVCMYIKTATDNNEITSLEKLATGKLFDKSKPIWLRTASSCEFGMFGDSHCDCEAERTASLCAIGTHGQGIYVQLPQEGLGRGLMYKAQELELQVSGTTPDGNNVGPKNFFEAAKLLIGDHPIDQRKFGIIGTIFTKLGLDAYSYTLLSSNPNKVAELAAATGIAIIGSLAVQAQVTQENMGVYLAKVCEGMAVPDDELRQIHDLLLRDTSIPARSHSLIQQIADRLAQGQQFPSDMRLLQNITSALPRLQNPTN